MNFEDEHYVRIYTRDTKTWKRWGWEGQTVFMHVMRKLDKAGVMDDIDDPVPDVALMTGLPESVVEVGLPKVLGSGALEIIGTALVAPKYIEAQTAAKSDRVRARESRERRAALARSRRTDCHDDDQDGANRDGCVTNCDTEGEFRDEPSQPVTTCHPTQSNAEQRSALQRSPMLSSAESPKPPSTSPPGNLQAALLMPIQERARFLIRDPHSAQWVCPHRWPEVVEVAEWFCSAMGWHKPAMVKPTKTVMKLVELLAAFSAEDLQRAAANAPKNEWLSKPDQGLTSLSDDVVCRLLNMSAAPPGTPAQSVTDAERQQAAEAYERHQRRLRERNRRLLEGTHG